MTLAVMAIWPRVADEALHFWHTMQRIVRPDVYAGLESLSRVVYIV